MADATKFEPEFPVKDLLFDPDNPRLVHEDLGKDQTKILEELWLGEAATIEVAQSIAENGFYKQDPLFILPPDKNGKSFVIEGNRRLAAIQVLIDPRLRPTVKAGSLKTLNTKARNALKTVPVWIYPDRQSLWAFLGFKHINGVRPWTAHSKAEYIVRVYEKFEPNLDRIAERIGDNHSTVKRLYRGLRIINQAEKYDLYHLSDRWGKRFAFSHIYTAADQRPFQEFLGIDKDAVDAAEPVNKGNHENLTQLLVWVYGRRSTGNPPVIRSQNPDLGRLRAVIGHQGAISLLQKGYGLEKAWEESLNNDQRFLEALTEAKVQLQQALGMAPTGYTDDPDQFDTALLIRKNAEALVRQMEESSRSYPVNEPSISN